jgi:hypothetical protein
MGFLSLAKEPMGFGCREVYEGSVAERRELMEDMGGRFFAATPFADE